MLATGSPQQQATLFAVARSHGVVRTVASPQVLHDLARDRRIDLVVIRSVTDLGATSAVHRLLAFFATAKIRLIVTADGVDLTNCDGALRLSAAIVEQQRVVHRERARQGRAAAKQRGVCQGRPPRVIDLERARALRAEGMSVRKVARLMEVSPKYVRRHLAESSR
ncbi:MAG: recombinase family protein [Proteobacteria bacterium]|nr:recombinase family protein [Pseudomonadota bacterium]